MFVLYQPVIEMEMQFPKEYPMFPPFVRVIRPRFKFLTGKNHDFVTDSNKHMISHKGHVTIGGSICMEMLTRSGWSPSNDIEVLWVEYNC